LTPYRNEVHLGGCGVNLSLPTGVHMEQKQKTWGVLGLGLVVLLTISVIGAITPWAFHMGGRFTPLYWSGTGTLVAKTGTYPLYMLFYPADGSNALHGWGSVCISQDAMIPLDLHGDVGKAWRSLDDASMEIDLSEPLTARDSILAGYRGGGISLAGRWHGPELVLHSSGYMSSTAFRSGVTFEDVSVTLRPGRTSDFKAACSRIPDPLSGR
jgi:hypothetical protein